MKNFGETGYFWYRDHMEIKEKAILFDISEDCGTPDIREELLKELAVNEEYKNYTIYLCGKRAYNSGINGNHVKWLNRNSSSYHKVLATAKYLICDGNPVHYYTKRPGQIVVNISFYAKDEAKDIRPESISNRQKGLFDSDYLLCQNEEVTKQLIKAYMLENFATAKLWIIQEVYKEETARLFWHKLLFDKKNLPVEELAIPYNGKKNVLIYLGGLGKNGLTTSGVNLLNQLDREKNNYAVFCCKSIIQSNPENIRVIPNDVPFIFYQDYRCLTFWELLIYILWRGFGLLPFEKVKSVVTRMGKRNAERMLSGCRIDTAVHFTGYNNDMIATMEHLPGKRVIFVHSDMEKEIKFRGNVNKGLLSHAYKAYDNVAVVTAEMIPPAQRIAEGEAKFVLCPNVIDEKRILALGQQPLKFDQDTVVHDNEKSLLEALSSDKKKFISVGRFSVEKGHARLIRTFERLHKERPDTCLVIVGGSGNLWDKTVRQVQGSSCPEAIFLVRDMLNPFPLMKQCDCLVLSSFYEGFGLVLAEADVLGVPCFTVDIDGPRNFMQTYGGRIVEDSEDGIYEGMKEALQTGCLHRLSVDYEEYNKKAVADFEGLL